MDANTVESLIRAAFEDAEIQVEGSGANYDITVVSPVFEGLRPVKKQQLVYGALNETIASGAIHAVNIKTFTPEEWSAAS